jgi:uncharacterized protein (DUF305 family)
MPGIAGRALADDGSERYPLRLDRSLSTPRIRHHVSTLETRALAASLLFPLAIGCVSGKPPEAPEAPAAVPAAPQAPTAAMPAEHHHMPGMAMAPTIPKGALYTAADVHFMQGMIAHHGQAIHMSRLAASRGANARLVKFANKIDQSQEAEIRLMQEWLRANNQSAPEAESWRTMMMPGMLTTAELDQLDKARGVEFEKLFLTLMIRHHEGALRMVADLLATPRAAQDVDVSVFANDVEVVQTAEIGVMRQMLADY